MINLWLTERSAIPQSRCIGCGHIFSGGEDVQELRRGSVNSDFLMMGHPICLIAVGSKLVQLSERYVRRAPARAPEGKPLIDSHGAGEDADGRLHRP